MRLGILTEFPRLTSLCSPLYGGALAKPQEHWPHIFPGEFWATYPYFLPCLVSGCFTLFTFLVCAIFLKEVSTTSTVLRTGYESRVLDLLVVAIKNG